MEVTKESLRALHDPEKAGAEVRRVIEAAGETRLSLTRFVARYAAWNGLFGSGVACLAAKIGRSQGLFHEEGFPGPLADRSVLVASYFFDAARDEFDDRDTEHRDTHRCLAQATVAGLVESSKDEHPELREDRIVETLAVPMWLAALRDRVAVGYGNGTADELPSIFRAIGYHLGSELLADQEFSVIDETLRRLHGELVTELSGREVTIAGQPHRCYQWIGIHSGHGGGAEADHFEWAISGVRKAFEFVDSADHEALREQLDHGYRDFASDHDVFFSHVLR